MTQIADTDPLNDRRHVAFYLPTLQGGGAERVMVTLANGFAARGHRVDLVLVKAEGPYLPEVAKGVRVVDLNRSRVLASLPSLVGYLRHERPDVMLSALNHVNLLAIVARWLAGAKTRLVVSVHSSLVKPDAGTFTERMFRYAMRLLYPFADGIVAVSSGIADQLVDKLQIRPDKVTDIPNPIDIAYIETLAAEHPQHPWLAPGMPPVILAVGRLESAKDYPTLLDAFAQLRTGREVRLVILGEGKLRKELEDKIVKLGLEDSIALAGFQPNPFGWMRECSVYVLSSRFEGLPTSLQQAMACGARVVSTDCPTGPSQILENGRWGKLVPVGDVSALAKAIEETIDEVSPPDLRIRARDFSTEIIVKRYEDAAMSPH